MSSAFESADVRLGSDEAVVSRRSRVLTASAEDISRWETDGGAPESQNFGTVFSERLRERKVPRAHRP
jgi:hypothetical protein